MNNTIISNEGIIDTIRGYAKKISDFVEGLVDEGKRDAINLKAVLEKNIDWRNLEKNKTIPKGKIEIKGLYYDEDTFNIITESVDDEFNPDEVNAIDMDYILADTIAKYTLMETMYTIKLEDYNYDSIRKMTNNMLNK